MPGTHRCHVGCTASPDGEGAWALFLGWQEIGLVLAYVPEDGELQAGLPCETSFGLVLGYGTSRRPMGCVARAGLPLALLQARLPIKLPLLVGGGRNIGGG